MDLPILDIISTCYELSKKGEEYSQEVKDLRIALECLKTALETFESPDELPENFKNDLNESVTEATEMLQSSKAKPSFWSNIRSMLPGSDLEKLRDISQDLKNKSSNLGLLIGASNTKKKRKMETDLDRASKRIKREEMATKKEYTYDATVAADLDPDNMETLVDDGGEILHGLDQTAFSLKPIGETPIMEKLEETDFEDKFATWEEPHVIIERRQFAGHLINKLIGYISKQHCHIEGKRSVQKEEEEEEKDEENFPKPASMGNKLKVPDGKSSKPKTPEGKGKKAEDKGSAEKKEKNGDEANGEDKKDPNDSDDSGFVTPGEDDEEEKPEPKQKIIEEFSITDSSANGTYLNGKRLKKGIATVLESGDIIGIIMKKPANKELVFGFKFLDGHGN